jgi:hypothetical protein
MYYDEKWMEKQERGMGILLQIIQLQAHVSGKKNFLPWSTWYCQVNRNFCGHCLRDSINSSKCETDDYKFIMMIV